ncbi:S24 family peptidase [Desulfobaculum senezii]
MNSEKGYQRFIKAFMIEHLADLKRPVRLEYAKKLGISDRYLDMILRDPEKVPGKNLITKIPELFDLSLEEILIRGRQLSGESPELLCYPSEFALIPYLEQQSVQELATHVAFRRDWLHQKGNLNTMRSIIATGNSMAPSIHDGDVVLIDQSQRKVEVGKIFAVKLDDDVLLKRLEREPGHIILCSDNQDNHRPISISLKALNEELINFVIIGKCISTCRDLS